VPGVLVLGGYGAFGRRLCRLLAGAPEIPVFVAGRRLDAARAACRELSLPEHAAVALDRQMPSEATAVLRRLRPDVVIDAAGPFQGRDYGFAAQVASLGIHVVDLADDRGYVTGIGGLDAPARAAGVLVTSGASTVPALSVAVVDYLKEGLESVESIDVGIAPGHRGPRGAATVRAVLASCGKSIPAVAPAHRTVRQGWGDLTRHRYPRPVGGRWLSNVDLPDIALLPARCPGVATITLRAGLELSVLHLGLTLASQLVALGWVRSLEPATGLCRAIAAALNFAGSDAGAMHVTLVGRRGTARLARHWTLVAEAGDGPFVPASAASVIAKRLCGAKGYAPLDARGARPCVDLLSLEDFVRELRGRAIRTVMSETRLAGG
jgi:hypothetical protein